MVTAHDLHFLRYVVTDGAYSKQKCTRGVRALGLEQIGKLRLDANLRYLYQGPQRPGSGRPKTYDGKVHWDNLARFEKVETEDDDIVLYHQVLNHVQCPCNFRVVLVVDTKHHRRAVLFSTDVDLDALTIYLPLLQGALPNRVSVPRRQTVYRFDRLSSAFTGQTQLALQCQFERVTLAKLDARQHNGEATSAFSMASLKRRAFNHHLIERISQHLAKGHSLEKSSPEYEQLCNYGTITEMAA